MKKQKHFTKGFTVFEFVVALSIIGLIAFVSVPNFSRWIASYRLEKDSRGMSSELVLARARAITEGRDISLRIDTGSGYSASYVISPGGQPRHMSKSVTISEIVGDNPIIFNSRGMVLSETTVQFVNARGMTASVKVNPAGRVKFTRGS
jgi:Tfp pilus assembly protein FimT